MDMVEMLNHKQRAMADFYECLAEFRELTKDVTGRSNATKKFNNLKEFHAYHAIRHPTNPYYVKKTDKNYAKSDIPSKIPFKRQENPKEWQKQYAWFKNHPEAKVYAPMTHSPNKKKSRSEIGKKIGFLRSENPKEYDKQYIWFQRNPKATEYDPSHPRGRPRSTLSQKVTVDVEQDPIEYRRQYIWLYKHKDENPDKSPPRKIAHHTRHRSYIK